MKALTVAAGFLACLLTQVGQADTGADIYNKGGAEPAAMACVICHAADGMGMATAGFPRLAGLPAEYMRKQLADFRSGSRSNPVMLPIASALTEAEMLSVSAYIEQLPSISKTNAIFT